MSGYWRSIYDKSSSDSMSLESFNLPRPGQLLYFPRQPRHAEPPISRLRSSVAEVYLLFSIDQFIRLHIIHTMGRIFKSHVSVQLHLSLLAASKELTSRRPSVSSGLLPLDHRMPALPNLIQNHKSGIPHLSIPSVAYSNMSGATRTVGQSHSTF